MLPVEIAIQRVRRDITLAAVLRWAFLFSVFGCLVIAPSHLRAVAVTVIVFVGLWLLFTSARGSRLAADSPSLIASGQFDEAERQIDLAMRTSSLFRAVKLHALHQLAVLRHAQHRWQESALVCRALLGGRLAAAGGLSRQTRLMLAESLLEMKDLPGAHGAILGLYREKLPLAEVLGLMALQLDYESQLGAWQNMMNGAATKTQFAELMPAPRAARAQALMALAARKTGREDWAQWLAARARLLADVKDLCANRPILAELWKTQD